MNTTKQTISDLLDELKQYIKNGYYTQREAKELHQMIDRIKKFVNEL